MIGYSLSDSGTGNHLLVNSIHSLYSSHGSQSHAMHVQSLQECNKTPFRSHRRGKDIECSRWKLVCSFRHPTCASCWLNSCHYTFGLNHGLRCNDRFFSCCPDPNRQSLTLRNPILFCTGVETRIGNNCLRDELTALLHQRQLLV